MTFDVRKCRDTAWISCPSLKVLHQNDCKTNTKYLTTTSSEFGHTLFYYYYDDDTFTRDFVVLLRHLFHQNKSVTSTSWSCHWVLCEHKRNEVTSGNSFNRETAVTDRCKKMWSDWFIWYLSLIQVHVLSIPIHDSYCLNIAFSIWSVMSIKSSISWLGFLSDSNTQRITSRDEITDCSEATEDGERDDRQMQEKPNQANGFRFHSSVDDSLWERLVDDHDDEQVWFRASLLRVLSNKR